MAKKLYEEALADVKKIKEIAEANAQKAILEAVTPRIRDLIENEMLGAVSFDDEDSVGAPGSVEPEGELMTDLVLPVVEPGANAAAITPPDAEGKVTLDIDALCTASPEAQTAPMPGMPGKVPAEFEMSLESVDALTPLVSGKSTVSKKIEEIAEGAKLFASAGSLVKRTSAYREKISQMISSVEDMYGYVQENVSDPASKSVYENKLEGVFAELNTLQESIMSKKTNKMMNEGDVTLKLTDLPDDIDLDAVGVDLVADEEGEEGELDLDAGGEEGDEGAEGSDDLDLDSLDLEEPAEEGMGEGLSLSDDTIVEIDEGMLKREILRMRKLREEALPSMAGGHDASVLDDFGGGSDEGEPTDADMPHKSDAVAALPLGEADEDLEEMDHLDELDEMDQVGDRRTRDSLGGSATSVPSLDKSNPAAKHEALKRRLSFEKRLQERAKSRAASLKKEAANASPRKVAQLKSEYAKVAKRFNESLARGKKLESVLAESASARKGSNLNGGSVRSAESKTEKTLRGKLAETNLINAKLMYTNKLLQSESLTNRQKASVIEQLDSAKTVREAKLVYESLAKTLSGTSKSLTESSDKKVLGSSSRATRPASTQTLNEGYESDRWAKLAGIVKG